MSLEAHPPSSGSSGSSTSPNDLPSIWRPAEENIGQRSRCAPHHIPNKRAESVNRDWRVLANVEHGIRCRCSDDQHAALRLRQRCPGVEKCEPAWVKGIANKLADLPAPHDLCDLHKGFQRLSKIRDRKLMYFVRS